MIYGGYIVVTDRTSKIIKSCDTYREAKEFATLIRQASGEVTIFKALEQKKAKQRK